MLSRELAVAAGIAASYTAYYFLAAVRRPQIVTKKSPLSDYVLEKCSSLRSSYWPTFWCIYTHFSTFVGALRNNPSIQFRRDIFKTKDAGELCLDWFDKELPDTSPVVIIMPGLTGSSLEPYARYFTLKAHDLGFRPVVFNNRGVGDTHLTTPQGYCASFTSDLREVVRHVQELYPKAKVFTIGLSLGSIIMIKYLAEEGDKCPLKGAMAVSNAWDLFKASHSLESFPNRVIYNTHLAGHLKRYIQRHWNVFSRSAPFTLDHVMQVNTVGEFDAKVICPMFKYPSREAYYNDAMSPNHIHNVRVPLLCLNAADDVFAPIAGIPFDKFSANPYTMLVLNPWSGFSYMDRVLGEFASAVLADDCPSPKNA
eukprot:Colp12_sorted_trinity150504_noHs@10945